AVAVAVARETDLFFWLMLSSLCALLGGVYWFVARRGGRGPWMGTVAALLVPFPFVFIASSVVGANESLDKIWYWVFAPAVIGEVAGAGVVLFKAKSELLPLQIAACGGVILSVLLSWVLGDFAT